MEEKQMGKQNWFLRSVLLLALGIVLAACQPSTPPEATDAPDGEETDAPDVEETDAPDETQAPEEEGDPKVATLIWTQEFDSLSPIYTNMWFTTNTYPIWNVPAWMFDDTNTAIPVLVTEIPSVDNGGISEDGRTITITLRDDLTWSDGEPLTSADFAFTHEMIMDSGNAVNSQNPHDLVESVETPDEWTVVTTFIDPYAPWLAKLWTVGLLPQHVLRPVFEAEGTLDNAEWNLAPTVGVGPYVFAEWETGSYARFVRNENYWGTPANIDEIFIRFVPDDASQTAALINGEGDLGTFPPLSDVPTLQDAGVNVMVQPSGYNEGFYFRVDDLGHPALQDVNVRRAIALATDRFSLNEDLLLGLTQPANGYWDAYSSLIDPSVEVWPYDPDEASALLDEAGWVDSNGDGTRDRDGVELVLRYGTTTRQIRADTQAVLQQQLAEVGIGVELLSYESDVFFATFADGGPGANGELDMWHYSGAPSWPDPDSAQFLCSEVANEENPQGINDMGLCDEELDALFAAQASEVNPEARAEIFKQITKMMYEKVYWIGLWQDPDYWIVGSRLTNVKFSGGHPLFNVAEWDIAGE
jgi:peptide/nickel transport system substrate-binding protein